MTKENFSPLRVSNIPVQAGIVYHLSLKLALGSTSTEIKVTANAVSVETTTTSQATVLETSETENIPLNGRDFTQVLTVTPGYAGYGVGFSSAINGAQASQTNWQIEGADNNDLWLNTSASQPGRRLRHSRRAAAAGFGCRVLGTNARRR